MGGDQEATNGTTPTKLGDRNIITPHCQDRLNQDAVPPARTISSSAPSSGKHWRQRTINSDGTVSRPKESTERKLSYEEEGEPVQAKMKRIIEVEADEYGDTPLKNHVRLTIAIREHRYYPGK